MKAIIVVAATLSLLVGCATTSVHDACTRISVPELPDGWTAYSCPHPFPVAGYGWRPAMTRPRTKEILVQEGYEYLIPHEVQHAYGMTTTGKGEWPVGASSF
jgi:hypothetical protein